MLQQSLTQQVNQPKLRQIYTISGQINDKIGVDNVAGKLVVQVGGITVRKLKIIDQQGA